MIRVVLPFHLRNLAKVSPEVLLEVVGTPTLTTVLEALEAKYPTLRGTIRDHGTLKRRPMLRFFVCEEDWSFESPDKPLPEVICSGADALWVVGAISGG
ncbi:MAG: MoaD/ThiS family protein [Gemmataceae bacterium]